MKPRSTTRLAFPLASAIASLLAAHSASAINLYWDTNSTTTGSGAATGNWDGSTALWNSDSTGGSGGSFTAATTNADDLFFSAGTTGTAGTVTVSGTRAAHSITFEEGAITLTGGTIDLGSATAGSGISFANVSGYNFNSAIVLNSAATAISFTNKGNQSVTFGATGSITGSATTGTQTVTIGGAGAGGGSLTFSGIISDGGGGGKVGVTVNGWAGMFGSTNLYTLGAANTYTGATNIINGALSISNASTFTNTSAINLTGYSRLIVNAANASLAKLSTAGGGSGVVAGSYLRFSQAQTTAGAGNGPGTIFGTVELNVSNVNPNYTLDFGAGGALTSVLNGAVVYTSPLTLSGTASIDSSSATVANTITLNTGGITASTTGAKTLNLTGTNTGGNTISSAIGNGSGSIGLNKGGGGSWTLSGTNTYTGNTRVDAGTLQFTNQVSLYNNGAAATWTKDNIIVGNGATLAFNVGGAGQFTKANINTLLGLSDSASNGFMSGSNVGIDTTGGSLLFDSVIANTNSGSNVLGLTKLGTNTLTLDQNNTYTGRTVISGGTLQLGNGSTTGKLSTSSSILNNGTFTINRSNAVAQGTDFSAAPIVGTGAFVQAGSGTTTLNAANTFSGTTTVSAGTLTLANALALQNSALVTTGAGSSTISGITTLTLGGLSGASGNLGSASVLNGYTGAITALTLNPNSGSVSYGGVISNGSGAMTLTKTGAGTQVLYGTNTYTGTTFVNGGVLQLDFSQTGAPTSNIINSTSVLSMGGGQLTVTGKASTTNSQTFASTSITAGANTISDNANATSNPLVTNLGAITRTVGSTVNFSLPVGTVSATNGITTTNANTNGIIGGWATVGATGASPTWAVNNGSNNIIGLAAGSYTTTATAGTTASNYLNANIDVTTSAGTIGGTINANSFRFNTLGAFTVTLAAGDNIVQSGGILVGTTVGNNLSTITGGSLLGSASGDLIVHQNNTSNSLTISSIIKDNGGATALTKSGAGNLNLNALNTFSGGLIINAGNVTTGQASSVSSGGTGTGAITINSGGKLTLSTGVGTINRTFNLNGGTLAFAGSGADLTAAGTMNLNANSIIDATNTNSGFPIITANISGAGGFTKTNSGGLRLNGTNTFTGPMVVSAGGVTVKSSLYGNDTSKWTPANITVASGATLVLNVQGSGEFTIAQATTMFSQLSSNVNNNGLQAGAIIGVDTRNAAAGTYTYSSDITDSTGAGGGSVSFKHTGTSSTILELTGANTYSGMSIVDNGSFLKVSSINSVFTNAALGTVHSASSSLGAPTTVANGTIHLGTGGSTAQSGIGNTFQTAGLIYTGIGETTDRIVSLNDGGTSATPSILDQSGTGNLKFISPFVTQDNRGPKILQLQGSTTGTGEIASSIGDLGNNLQLTKSGTGTWTLSGANYYLGVTTVNGGALVLANSESLKGGIGATGGLSALTFNGGVIGLGAGDFSRPLATAGTAGAATFTGNGGWAAYNADRVVNLGGASATITWATANTGLNAKTLILGNATATHMVTLQNPLDLGTAARTVQVDNGAAAIDGALSGVLSGGVGGNLVKTGAGTLALTNANTYIGTTLISAGTLQIGNGGTTGSLSTSSAITNNATLVFKRSDTITQGIDFANSIGGAGAVTQAGSGTLILSGTNSYAGTTNVTDGTLIVNGNISTSVLTTVQTGATLGGSGTVGDLTIDAGAILSPGNSPGILTVDGNYIQNGTLVSEITGLTAGTQHDQVVVNGTVTLNGALSLSSFTGFTPMNGDLIFILLNDNTDAISGTFTGLAQGAVVGNYLGFDWQISYTANSGGNSFTGGNDVALMAIPEPRAALLGGLGLLALLRRRRA